MMSEDLNMSKDKYLKIRMLEEQAKLRMGEQIRIGSKEQQLRAVSRFLKRVTANDY